MPEQTLEDAFARHLDGVILTAHGQVSKLLEDDLEGTPHQRFIMTTPQRQTLLVLNNLDRAFRLPLQVGESVEVRGQYRWNRHGGLMHETHHDTRAAHKDGWILLMDVNQRNSKA